MKIDAYKQKNNEMLKRVAEKGNQNANAKVAIDLDLSLIDENVDNSSIFSMDDIERLAKTIEEEGFAGAIEVYKKPDGRYEISAGHRRKAAVAMLGWKTIPALVSTMPESEIDIRTRLVSSNLNSRELSNLDKARAIKYHKETLQMKYGIKDGERVRGVDITQLLCEKFGISNGYITDYIRLAKLPEYLNEFANDKDFPWRNLTKANGLTEEQLKKLASVLKEEKGHGKITPGKVDEAIKLCKEEGGNKKGKKLEKSYSSPEVEILMKLTKKQISKITEKERVALSVKLGEISLWLQEINKISE